MTIFLYTHYLSNFFANINLIDFMKKVMGWVFAVNFFDIRKSETYWKKNGGKK